MIGMNNPMRQWRIDFFAGIGTWAVVSGIVLWVMAKNPVSYVAMLEPTIALLLLYLVSMLASNTKSWSLATRRTLHAIQLLSVFALAALISIDFLPIFTIIWIAMMPSQYPWRACLVALVGVMLGWWAMLALWWGDDFAVETTALYATFHVFALMSARSAMRAEAARDHTQALYAELVATQHLLSEASRQSERTRIARDLHDLVGHHLTALSINLQIAERQADGEARERIEQARGLARLLLADVREAVSSLRDQGTLDLRRSLELLVENVPQLDVTLEVDATVSVEDVEIADAIIRCVQEAITNSLRHSTARHSWVRVYQEDGEVHVDVRDDGGAESLDEGNGIKGMRERLQAVGGTLAVQPAPEGVALRAVIPLAA